jgi:hypothetical protein
MSSDTFHIRVEAIEGNQITLRCFTSTAGGLNDFSTTRSFALMAIESGAPLSSPLFAALREAGSGSHPPLWEESFHREHVDRFVARTELLERRNVIADRAAWFAEYETGKDVARHEFVLRVTLRDAGFASGLAVGDAWGTTAFDAWLDDPAGATRAEIEAVSECANYWAP